jgi:hypothetical protein
MQRIASEPTGGRMAQGRDTARHILGLGQAAIGISQRIPLVFSGGSDKPIDENTQNPCLGVNESNGDFATVSPSEKC